MKSLLFVPALALTLLGAGCASAQPAAPVTPTPTPISTTPTTTSPTAPTSTVPLPAATSTLPLAVHADWSTEALFDGWTIRYPATASKLSLTSADQAEGKLLRVDLGTAVQSPAGRSVPKRTLEIIKLKPTDYRVRGCDPSLIGEQNISLVQAVGTVAGTVFCLQASSDAGAGNLYDVQDYIFATDTGSYAFTFVTHSVQCGNFPDPAVQCVGFEAGRDLPLFRDIMGSVVRK